MQDWLQDVQKTQLYMFVLRPLAQQNQNINTWKM